MLKLGGYINIIIAIAHIIGLFWADQMFEVTGIGKEMTELAQTHFSLPYLMTIFVAIVFFIFGLYGLSADNKFRQLPFLKLAIFTEVVLFSRTLFLSDFQTDIYSKRRMVRPIPS